MSTGWSILHGGALGDLVLTIELALRVCTAQPVESAQLITRAHPGDLSTCRPNITRLSLEGLAAHRLYVDDDSSPPHALATLVRGRCVLNALGGIDSVVHRRLTQLNPERLYSFDPRPREGIGAHITEQWQEDLEKQGLSFQDQRFAALCVPNVFRRRGSEVLARAGCDAAVVLIHPGSGGRAKCWPLARFLDVARRVREAGRQVCFLTGPVEEERWTASELDAVRGEFPAFASPEPDTLAHVLAAGRVLLSNDSGPAHLAALLGTPTVTVFGPTSPTVWRPLGPRAQVILGDRQGGDDWGIDAGDVAHRISAAAGAC